MTMDRNDGGVDHGVFHIRIVRDRLEYALEHATLRPVVEALENGVPVAEPFRQIAPGTVRARLPQHRLDKQPVVLAAAPGIRRLAKAMRSHLLPLSVTQYHSNHQSLQKGALNHLTLKN